MNPLNAYLAQSVIDDRYRLAEAHGRAVHERPQERAPLFDAVTIRRVTPDDWKAVERLAALESAPAPHQPALLAEVDDRVLAVRSLDDGATVADPFHPTAELVRLLEARSKQLGGTVAGPVARPLRRAAARVAAIARH
jgi:hypothetical protein